MPKSPDEPEKDARQREPKTLRQPRERITSPANLLSGLEGSREDDCGDDDVPGNIAESRPPTHCQAMHQRHHELYCGDIGDGKQVPAGCHPPLDYATQ